MNCTIILARHSGMQNRHKVSEFVAGQLPPLIDGKVNLIHEGYPNLPIDPSILENMEALSGKSKFKEKLRELDRGVKSLIKKDLARMDRGESPELFPSHPEIDLILQKNSIRAGSISNHLGFYPPLVIFEMARARTKLALAEEEINRGETAKARRLYLEAHEAIASVVIHSDFDLARQLRHLGGTCVVLRNLYHAHLAELEKHSITTFESGLPSDLGAQMTKNIGLRVIGEKIEPTFGERAVFNFVTGSPLAEAYRELTPAQMHEAIVSDKQAFG